MQSELHILVNVQSGRAVWPAGLLERWDIGVPQGTDAELDALIDAVEARIVTLEGKVADLESGVGDQETSVQKNQ